MGTQLLIAVATYNEIDSLPRLVDSVFHYAPTADVLVVDDNSPDGTGNWCDQRAATDPRLRVIHRAGKLGLGTATIAALRYAIAHGYEYVINMDADLSHQPRDIPRLLAGMDTTDGPRRVDVMIGSRYVAGGAIEGWPPLRHVMSRAVNLYARWMLGLGCRDCSGAFRCYRVAMLRQLDFDKFQAHGYAFLEELLWHLQRLGCRMAEVPITFVNRVEGQSKINTGEAVHALWTILRLGIRGRFGGRRGNGR